MQSKVKLLGHAVHPMLIVFPLGLLGASPIFDAVHLATDEPFWGRVAFWLITAGVIGGLLAAVPGFIDWLSIPSGTRAKRVGATHMIVNVCALALFVVSWIARVEMGVALAGVGPFVLSLIGVVFAVVGGWFGGELVERLGVGVHERAHLDAPSSLDEGRLVRRSETPAGTQPI